MSIQFLALVAKLKEVFQIDRPDLDFGVYRILNARSKEIEEFLNQRLKKKVETSLQESVQSLDQNVLKDLEDELRDEYGKRAFDESGKLIDADAIKSHLGKKYLALKDSGANRYADESQVYNHLLTFFSRYYDEGDFISQRRYKGDTYAIPYSGEEVMLHWANKDQYYTKSGEMFSNYRFKLANGKSVLFKLLSADTARENRKDNDKNRCFNLVTEVRTIVKYDEDGEEYEEVIHPFEIIDNELVCLFEYISFPTTTKQPALNAKALDFIVESNLISTEWKAELLTLAPTEKDNKRTELQKHLDIYTQKNTADYFIHKNLGKFLRNELDFYIKNEVMHLDNVMSSDDFTQIERQLTIIKCLRQVGLEIIDFLASLEDFQKKLWLKKKFVVSSHYCITLDRLEESFYQAIVENKKQWDEWESLGFREKTPNWQTLEYLQAHPYMMVNTALFDLSFKAKLLNSIDDIDEQTNGLIIHSDNFQALNLLQTKYQEKIQATYIDPPYNTDASSIFYKNGYKDSSWLSLMFNVLSKSYNLSKIEGNLCLAIDDVEYTYIHTTLHEVFPKKLGTAVIRSNPVGRKTSDRLTPVHEYAIFSGASINANLMPLGKITEQNIKRYPHEDENGRYSWLNFIRTGTDDLREESPTMYFPIVVGCNDELRIPKMEYVSPSEGYQILENIRDDEVLVYPIKNIDGVLVEKRWQRGWERFSKELSEYRVRRTVEGIHIDFKARMDISALPRTWWESSEYASSNQGALEIKNLFKKAGFSFPKSKFLVKDCIKTLGLSNKETVLDYFGGSGTTAHATIELNREDNGNRKYILVEQGEYFDTVIQPRIQKIVYSKDWKDGKPISDDTGISHCLKIMKLESYEDTLNNLELKRSGDQERLFNGMKDNQKDDYLMHYMLNIESKDSLLNIKDFQKPFDYQMNITTDSAGAYEKQKVDLVETFNYLIGLEVQYIDSQLVRGYIQVTGKLRDGDKATILWRDCDKIGYEELTELLDKKLKISASDSEYDVIYINGDHTINNRLITDGKQGGKNLKIRSVEQEFLTRMFEGE